MKNRIISISGFTFPVSELNYIRAHLCDVVISLKSTEYRVASNLKSPSVALEVSNSIGYEIYSSEDSDVFISTTDLEGFIEEAIEACGSENDIEEDCEEDCEESYEEEEYTEEEEYIDEPFEDTSVDMVNFYGAAKFDFGKCGGISFEAYTGGIFGKKTYRVFAQVDGSNLTLVSNIESESSASRIAEKISDDLVNDKRDFSASYVLSLKNL